MDIRPHLVKPPIERFMALIKVSTEHFYDSSACWDWLGSKSKDGYGQFILSARRGQQRVRVSPYRFIWEYFNGPMADGLEPDHLCNRRSCCNPAHIEPVTHSENQKRSYQRGRKRGAYNPRHPTHCPHGHAYTPTNTVISSQGSIQCRECNRLRCLAYKDRTRPARRPRVARA
jgi:hypothetical protein